MELKRRVKIQASDRPHAFTGSGFYEATGELCESCGDVERSPWHWVEVGGKLEPPA